MSEKRKKSVIISVRFSPEEFLALAEIAEFYETPVSTFMRNLALKEIQKTRIKITTFNIARENFG